MRAKSTAPGAVKPVEMNKTYSNGFGMEFVPIPAGSFLMGADVHFDGMAAGDELPQHTVTISKPFLCGKYPVTQQQWVAVMGSNPSAAKGRTLPVERVSWEDAQAFVRTLNEKENTQAYRLPSEAEWEYAARAGSVTNRPWGDGAEEIALYAWCGGPENGVKSVRSVGRLKPNAWGLYDMLGNAHEWCLDWYGAAYYGDSPVLDPKGPAEGSTRVLRGGSWNNAEGRIRSAYRFNLAPDSQFSNVGFRVVMVR
ncbi:MAG: formylglycine-generating enzyme family protein [Magnetococcales bacterium]|nr:formylglycine-generating enzyme family protein [Magnetococcales bacterium]MBF0115204.1 formylglycine-generating enzyme family protein [Magnetococcales bacterium]